MAVQDRRQPTRYLVAAVFFLHLGWSTPSSAQAGSGAGVPSGSGVNSYEQHYTELKGLRPVAERASSVQRLVLKRDVGEFTLDEGTLHLLSPVAGRVVGAVFVGKGTFSFTPPSSMEQQRLALFEKNKKLVTPLTGAVFLFADSTGRELERQLTFGTARVPGEAHATLSEAVRYLCDDKSRSFDPDLMEAFLNGDSTDLFYAHIRRPAGDPLMFALNPRLNEAVQLTTRARRTNWSGKETEVVSQFARQGDTLPALTYERKPLADIRHYQIDTRLEHTSMGDVRFSATARLLLTAEASIGPWVPLWLFEKLEVDSARWADGEPAEVVKSKDNPVLWLNLGRRLSPGETRSLSLSYRGDLIDRFGDWFFIKSSAWYPIPLDGRSLASFDLTYRTPLGLVLASVGERKDSTLLNRTVVTRWVTPNPVTFAAFNVGRFKEHRVQAEGVPPITVLASEDAHKAFTRELLRRGVAGAGPQRNMKEVVGADVLNSMKFFSHVFGPAPLGHFYATEVPYFHGLAFPGLVHLSWVTFRNTHDEGFDEFFRAHEVAHQWWGLGVDYTTYHEQWLSEGFASFAGLWYLQTVRKNKSYFDMLDRWRADIVNRRNEPAPVWLGRRNRSGMDEAGYGVIVYHKGAWALHMLRIMMLDLKTMNEDRFTGMIRDFYQSYQGKRASTEDFRKVAERHAGMDLGWFFDQWIYGADIPSYRVVYRTEPAEGGQFRVKLQVLQENVPETFQAYVPVTLDLGQERVARLRVKVRGPRSEIDLPLMPARPKSLRFNDLQGVLAEVKSVEEK